ncbi:excisionase [Comamonas koreensis]|uniref:Excisionase n=1 Tax=Comamonas koreensis TaxID=160825 RepID=A0AAW4XVL6_9BURK|nr:excisionase [Comamonas koreensis]MCD2165575.1 excisionase [Comamonas koreensis]
MATTKAERPIVNAARFVTVELASAMTGLSAAAIRKRIERGVWLQDKEWRRGPDDRVWIDTKGIEAWVLQKSGMV